MPDWTKLAVARTFDVPEFRFDSGERTDLRLHCRILGDMAPHSRDAVLMLHGTVGSGKQFLQPETADALFDRGQPLAIAKYCIVLPDAIGHGLSSKPSDGLGTAFPRYGYGDMVRAQHLVVKHLGLEHLRLVLGTSMGALNAAMNKVGGASVSLTYVTGALVKFGQGAGNWLTGRRADTSWLLQAPMWASLLAGSIVAVMVQRLGA